MSLPDVIAQRLASPELFDDLIIDGVTWFVGYGIELQLLGPTRHLSISHPLRVRIPDEFLIREIGEAFGFCFGNSCKIDLTLYPRRGMTIHLLEPYTLCPGVGGAS